jgi:Fe-S-cluster containining protein
VIEPTRTDRGASLPILPSETSQTPPAPQLPLRGPDGLLLGALKAVVRWIFLTSAAMRRRRGFSRYVLAGDCNQCAVCCEQPRLMVDWFTWNVQPFRRLFLAWQRAVNGFELVAAEPRHVFAFRCRYFDTQTRACTSYKTRPGMCRDYPRFLLEQPDPVFFSECGYRAVAANASRLLRIVNRADLSDEKREEMKRRLRLE